MDSYNHRDRDRDYSQTDSDFFKRARKIQGEMIKSSWKPLAVIAIGSLLAVLAVFAGGALIIKLVFF